MNSFSDETSSGYPPNLPRSLLQWQEYLDQSNSECAALATELHKLLLPWPSEKTHLPDVDHTKGDGEVKVSSLVSAEEERMLQELKKGLEKANKARDRAVKNLLPEVQTGLISSGTECQVNNKEDAQVKECRDRLDDVAIVTDSVLKDLIQRHSKASDPKQDDNPGKRLTINNRKKLPAKFEPINIKKTSKVEDKATGKSKPKAVVRLPKPVSAQKRYMYKTSSSDIGKGIRGRESNKGLDKRRLTSSGSERSREVGGGGRIGSLPPRSDRLLSGGKVRNVLDDKKGVLVRDRNVKGQHAIENEKVTVEGINTNIAKASIDERERSELLARHTSDGDVETRLDHESGECEVVNMKSLHQRRSNPEPIKVEETAFELLKDGKSLKIPASLKKLLSSNSKWRSKIKQSSKFKSPKTGGFLEKLNNSSADQGQTLIASEMCREYEHLLESTAAISNKVQQKQGKAISSEELTLMEEHLKQIESRSKQLEHQRGMLMETGEAEQRPVEPPASMPAGVLRYETLRQLQTYVDLQLRVRIIENQLQVEQTLAALLLPRLNSLDPRDRHTARIYRHVEGLLCHGGELFPSLVKFSDSDEEDDIATDEDDELVDACSRELPDSGVT